MSVRIAVLFSALCLSSSVDAQQIIDNGDPANREFKIDYPTYQGNHEVWLTNDAALGFSRIESSVTGSFQSITFTNPTVSLLITLGDGTNTFHLHTLDDTFTAVLQVQGEGGEDTMNVYGLSKFVISTIISGQDGNDVFNIGAGDENLNTIQGDLIINGNNHGANPVNTLTIRGTANAMPVGDSVNFLDTGDLDGATYSMSGSSVSKNGDSIASYSSMESVLLDTSGETNNVTVGNTVNFRNIMVDAGNEKDVITVQSTAQFGNTTIKSRSSQDNITIDNGGNGEFLVIESGAYVDTITINKVPANGRTQIDGGDQGDFIYVNSTDALSLLEVLGGPGSEFISITPTSTFGTVYIDGQSHALISTEEIVIGGVTNSLPEGDGLSMVNFVNKTPLMVTDSNIQFSGLGNIFYTGLESIAMNVNLDTNTITIDDTADALNLRITSSSSFDTPFVINDLGSLANVELESDTGDDHFMIHGSGNAFVAIQCDDGSDIIGVTGCGAGSRFGIESGAGSDTFIFGAAGLAVNGQIADVEGLFVLDGNGHDVAAKNSVAVKGITNTLVVGDTLILNDIASIYPYFEYLVSSNDANWLSAGYVQHHSNIESFQIAAGNITNTTYVNSSLDGSNIEIYGGSSDDYVQINSLGVSANLECRLGSGEDTIDFVNGGVGAFSILSPLLGDDTVNILTNAVNDRILIETSTGDDAINIKGVASGSIIDVKGGDDNDEIYVSSVLTDTNGTLGTVLGTLCIDGEEHAAAPTSFFGIQGFFNTLPIGDKLTLGDAGSSAGENYVINTGTVTRSGKSIDCQNIETLLVSGGYGANDIDVIDTPTSVTVTATTGNGTDGVTVMKLGDNANVKINTGRNVDMFDVYNTGVGTFFIMELGIFNDFALYRGNGLSSRTRISGGQGFDKIEILSSAPSSVVEVTGGSEADTVYVGFDNVTPNSIQGLITADGQNPTTSPGDLLYVDGNDSFTYTDTGSVLTIPGFTPMFYQNFETVAVINQGFSVKNVGGNLKFTMSGTNAWDIIPEYISELSEEPQNWTQLPVISELVSSSEHTFITTNPGPANIYNFRLRFDEP